MKISVITVTLNSAATIKHTIQSILPFDGCPLEYVIVDGGSSDDTLDIIKKYAEQDDRIHWISEPDDGIADAFNKGLAMATGDWIGIIGSDDQYASGALQAIAETARLHPDADVIHGDLVRLDEKGKPLFTIRPSDVDRTIWHHMPINHPATFVSRKALAEVGRFDKDLKVAMDYDLVLRLYKAGAKFVHVDRPITLMSYGGASDERFLAGLKELRRIKMREGYPRWKADYWLVHRYAIESTKKWLRRLGLHGLLKFHPRFRGVDSHLQD